METYEIDDVRNRRDAVLPLVSVDIDIHRGIAVHLVVQNIGDIPAEDVRFTVSSDVEGLTSGNLTPNIITTGTTYLPPGKVHRLFLGSAIKKITKTDAPKFDVTAEYFNRRAGARITDTFHIDYADYINSAIVKSDITHEGERLAKCVGELTQQLRTVNDNLSVLMNVAGATGLDLSTTTLRNLKHLLDRDGKLERIPASAVKWQGFSEVLGIDRDLALRIEHFVSWPHGKLEDLEGMTAEIAELARAAFTFPTSEAENDE